MKELKAHIKLLADEIFDELVEIRRHIHANPELSFKEFETSKFIQKTLDRIGISYESGWAGTGIIAQIDGKSPNGRSIGLRGDMDALPIQEMNEVAYKSKHPNIMHACGHDVHTTSLLGALMILNKLKDKFDGRVYGFFQPGEEKLPGGASIMIKEGALKSKNLDHMFALHVHPPMEVGKVGFRGGKYMASADELYFKVIGKGGHAALPHKCIDTTLTAAQIIVNLQQVVSRNANPLIPSVLSIGKIESKGGATNIIPEEVSFMGTFRTMDEEWREEAHQRILDICSKTAESFGAKCEVDIKKGYPFLINDVKLTERAKINAIELLGSDKVEDLPIRMTSEDFSYFSQEVPSSFFRLGTSNNEKGINAQVHTANFDVDEECLKVSSSLLSWLCLNELNN